MAKDGQKKTKINILTISVSKLQAKVNQFFKENRKINKTVSKTHLINYLGLPHDWKQRLRQVRPGLSTNKKIEIILTAFNEIKEILIDSLLLTPEGRKIVYQTQFSTDNDDAASVVININKGVDPRGN